MISRRNMIFATAVAISSVVVPEANAMKKAYITGDTSWQSLSKQELTEKLTQFFGAAKHPLPLMGHPGDSEPTHSIFDQFIVGFFGVPRPLEQLSTGEWLFSGAMPHEVSYVSFVVMSPDQTRIEAAMMSYSLCPPTGVQFTDAQGGSHQIKCEVDPGWTIFLSRYEKRNEALVKTLSQIAYEYRLTEQRSMIGRNIRKKDEVRAKTEVILVP